MQKLKKVLSNVLWVLIFSIVIVSIGGFIYDLIIEPRETLKELYESMKVGITVFVIIIALIVWALNLYENDSKESQW